MARANKTKKILMKKLIQKTILIVSLAAFAVALPGCGGDAEEASPSEESEGGEEGGEEGGAE